MRYISFIIISFRVLFLVFVILKKLVTYFSIYFAQLYIGSIKGINSRIKICKNSDIIVKVTKNVTKI